MFRSKKWALVGAVFVINYISENIQKTGAFEVYLNGELITSKLRDGDYPEESVLFDKIEKALYCVCNKQSILVRPNGSSSHSVPPSSSQSTSACRNVCR